MNGQIGKYELLKWASPPGQSVSEWSDVAGTIGHKLGQLFPAAPPSAWKLDGFRSLLEKDGLTDLIDFEAVTEGKGRATFNFLALLYVLGNIQGGITAPIEFALPVDGKIQAFLQGEQSLTFLRKHQRRDLASIEDVVVEEQEELARSLKGQDLEHFLSEIESAYQAPPSAPDLPIEEESLAADQGSASPADKTVAPALSDDHICGLLVAELDAQRGLVDAQNSLIAQLSSQAADMGGELAVQTALASLERLSGALKEAFKAQIPTEARMLACERLAEAKGQARRLAEEHRDNQMQHYTDLCTYHCIEEAVNELKREKPDEDQSQQIISGLQQCIDVVQQVTRADHKEEASKLRLQSAAIASMEQQLAVSAKNSADLEQVGAALQELENSESSDHTPRSLADLCALEHLLISRQQKKLEGVQALEQRLNGLLRAACDVGLNDDHLQLHTTSYEAGAVVLEGMKLVFSREFEDLLKNLGIEGQRFTVALPENGQEDAAIQYSAGVKRLLERVGDGEMLLEHTILNEQVAALREFVSQLLGKFRGFYRQTSEKYDDVANLCRGLSDQLAELPEKYASKYSTALEQAKQDVELLADENSYLQQKVQSQQKQIQEFITELELAEQTNFEAKRMYERNKQLNSIIQSQSDVIEELLTGSRINLQQKLDDIQAQKGQMAQIENLDRKPVKFEGVLLIERARAEREHESAEYLRSQVAQLSSTIESQNLVIQELKLDCKAFVEGYVQ